MNEIGGGSGESLNGSGIEGSSISSEINQSSIELPETTVSETSEIVQQTEGAEDTTSIEDKPFNMDDYRNFDTPDPMENTNQNVDNHEPFNMGDYRNFDAPDPMENTNQNVDDHEPFNMDDYRNFDAPDPMENTNQNVDNHEPFNMGDYRNFDAPDPMENTNQNVDNHEPFNMGDYRNFDAPDPMENTNQNVDNHEPFNMDDYRNFDAPDPMENTNQNVDNHEPFNMGDYRNFDAPDPMENVNRNEANNHPYEDSFNVDKTPEEIVDPNKKIKEIVDPNKKIKEIVDPNKKIKEIVDPNKKIEEIVDPNKQIEETVDPNKQIEEIVDPNKKIEEIVDPNETPEEIVDPNKQIEEIVDPNKKIEKVENPNKKETETEETETEETETEETETEETETEETETEETETEETETEETETEETQKDKTEKDKTETEETKEEKKNPKGDKGQEKKQKDYDKRNKSPENNKSKGENRENKNNKFRNSKETKAQDHPKAKNSSSPERSGNPLEKTEKGNERGYPAPPTKFSMNNAKGENTGLNVAGHDYGSGGPILGNAMGGGANGNGDGSSGGGSNNDDKQIPIGNPHDENGEGSVSSSPHHGEKEKGGKVPNSNDYKGHPNSSNRAQMPGQPQTPKGNAPSHEPAPELKNRFFTNNKVGKDLKEAGLKAGRFFKWITQNKEMLPGDIDSNYNTSPEKIMDSIQENEIAQENFLRVLEGLKSIESILHKKEWSNSDREIIANALLDASGLELKTTLIEFSDGSYGETVSEYKVRKNEIKVHDYTLLKNDERSKEYKLKTIFHELYHAMSDGVKHDKPWNIPDKLPLAHLFQSKLKEWKDFEEVATECSAMTMLGTAMEEILETHSKEADEKIKSIIPAYSNLLVEFLPKLKEFSEFKDCNTVTDFGDQFLKYRFGSNYSITAEWGDKIKQVKKIDFNIWEYAQQYQDYVIKDDNNLRKIAEAIHYKDRRKKDSMMELQRNSFNYNDDFVIGNVAEEIKREWIEIQNDKKINLEKYSKFTMSLIYAMNNLGVKRIGHNEKNTHS